MLVELVHEQLKMFGRQEILENEVVADALLLGSLVIEKRADLKIRQKSEPDCTLPEAAWNITRRNYPIKRAFLKPSPA